MAFYGKELGDERLSQVTGGRSMSGYIEYAVKPGDTLTRIAQQYHVTEREILDLSEIYNPDNLYPGQILKIPVHIRC